jgi:O-antigen ligase
MDFFAVIIFLILYHIRPHEWIGAVETLRPAMIAMLMALYGTFTRDKGFSLGILFRTPHDWFMLAYLVWIVGTAPSSFAAWNSCYSLFLYYFVITLALSSVERMRVFLNWWALMLVLVAALAVASEFGFDPMYSNDLTHGRMKGRLVLNNYMFNNPNALGHSVVPVMAMVYFLFWWKRFITFKLLFLPFTGIAAWCVYLTQSKGAFLAAFATWLTAYMFRRPLVVKILIAVLATTVGIAALRAMPRMDELEKPRSEGGIQGRLWVFTWGLETMDRTWNGVGWGGFAEGFARESGFPKASHSSYVSVGAELGWPGLLLFIALIYCGFKTLLTARTTTDDEERVRRVLFVLLISYVVSSWMVGWHNRTVFWLMMAVIGAFHRHLLDAGKESGGELISGTGEPSRLEPSASPKLIGDAAVPNFNTTAERAEVPASAKPLAAIEASDENAISSITWKSFGWRDVVLILAATYVVIEMWRYVIYNL